MRANVVLPPWLGPETTKMRSGPVKKKSLRTTAPFPDELARQREVEGLAAVTSLDVCESLRLAEAQAGAPEFFDIRQVGDVELDLPVEARDLFVQILRVRRAKCVEGTEHVGMKQRQPIQHLRLDMVQPPPFGLSTQ